MFMSNVIIHHKIRNYIYFYTSGWLGVQFIKYNAQYTMNMLYRI